PVIPITNQPDLATTTIEKDEEINDIQMPKKSSEQLYFDITDLVEKKMKDLEGFNFQNDLDTDMDIWQKYPGKKIHEFFLAIKKETAVRKMVLNIKEDNSNT